MKKNATEGKIGKKSAGRTKGMFGKEFKILWELFAESTIPTLIRDMTTKQNLQYNEAMQKLTGYSHAELPDIESWLKQLYPEDNTRQQMMQIISQTEHRKITIRDDEYVIICKGGEERHVQFSIYNIVPSDESTTLQVVQAKDITYRIKTEMRTKELEESENRLKLALEGAKEGLWTIDFVKGKMYFSGHSAEMLGYSIEDLGETSNKWDDITHPEDWPRVEKDLQDHFEGRTSHYEAEYRARTKTGKWKWILGHGRVTRRDAQGKPLQAIGTHVDISKLKNTELNLRKSKERFKSLVENAPYGLLIINPDKKIEYFNPKFIEITGYLPEDLPDMDAWFKRAYPDDDYREMVRRYWQTILKKSDEPHEAIPQEFKVLCKDESVKILRIKHVTIKGKKHFVTYEDITHKANAEKELRLREQELRIKTENLEEANIALGVLLNKREKDKEDIENNILYNVKNQIMPYLEKLEKSQRDLRSKTFLEILKSNLNDMISPFSRNLSATYLRMTPKEILVANLIRDDKSTKEIASILALSESSIQFHRHNMRRKLGLVEKKINLKSYLQSLA